MITATVFLFIDSSMASCVSCAVSSNSWNCVSPACTLQPMFTPHTALCQRVSRTSSVGNTLAPWVTQHPDGATLWC